MNPQSIFTMNKREFDNKISFRYCDNKYKQILFTLSRSFSLNVTVPLLVVDDRFFMLWTVPAFTLSCFLRLESSLSGSVETALWCFHTCAKLDDFRFMCVRVCVYVQRQIQDFPNFSEKMHGNEENWTRGGGGVRVLNFTTSICHWVCVCLRTCLRVSVCVCVSFWKKW